MDEKVLEAAKADFSSERVSDKQTVSTIQDIYRKRGYVLDPHSAIGVTAALRSAEKAPGVHSLALATAHPAKFSVSGSSCSTLFIGFNDVGIPIMLTFAIGSECRGAGAQGRQGI